MKVGIAGASGFIGSAVVPHLESRGHLVFPIVRREPRDANEIYWKPSEGEIDRDRIAELDIVINFAGENIGSGLWTDEKKEKILRSRVDGTRLLAETMAAAEPKPKAYLAASAFGYYGDTGDHTVDESAPPGQTFLADVCRQWEEATQPAADAGIRVVNFRLGVVIDKDGGMLEPLLPIFKLGLGGKVGNGRQYLAWVTREDISRAIEYFITNEPIHGPVNLMAPQPVTNAEFTDTLGDVLGRPTFTRLPALVVKSVLGQMGEEMLLASCRAVPARLSTQGFKFKHPELREALRAVLDRND